MKLQTAWNIQNRETMKTDNYNVENITEIVSVLVNILIANFPSLSRHTRTSCQIKDGGWSSWAFHSLCWYFWPISSTGISSINVNTISGPKNPYQIRPQTTTMRLDYHESRQVIDSEYHEHHQHRHKGTRFYLSLYHVCLINHFWYSQYKMTYCQIFHFIFQNRKNVNSE